MFLCNSLDSLTVYSRNNDIKYISKSLKDATFYYIGSINDPELVVELKTLKSKSSSEPPPFDITKTLFDKLNTVKYDYNQFINADKTSMPISNWMYTFGHLITAEVNNNIIEIH
jgi:hypothetical protein